MVIAIGLLNLEFHASPTIEEKIALRGQDAAGAV
jgi:hypothetical protein